MKNRFDAVVRTGSLVVALAWVGAANLQSASKPQAAAGSPAPHSNPIPQSIYVVPSSFVDGRDPFFPNRKPWLNGQPVVPTPAPTPTVSLTLNGLSGTPENRLAIINYRTFAQGETWELTLGGRKTRVRCVEIKEKSVLVEAEGRQQELFLLDE